MSEPKRYYAVIPGAGEKEQQDIFHPYGVPFSIHPKGEWVRYEDYARLKAECQARQAENSVLAIECDSLKVEVERLTKAGDAMWNALLCSGCSECMGMYDCHDEAMKLWDAAKKGGQP
ncbi:MAG: hypothetical protein RIR91_2009 [Verrucomicrobiota bacterium]